MWIDSIPSGVTVTNYLNADAVWTNWPRDTIPLVVDCIPNMTTKFKINGNDRPLEWIGTDNHNVSEALRLGREIFYTEGYASMKDVDSLIRKDNRFLHMIVIGAVRIMKDLQISLAL